VTTQEEARIKKIESDALKLKQVIAVLHKQVNLLVAQNNKFKNTIYQQKLDIETLKRKP
jgi:hypothetical protein